MDIDMRVLLHAKDYIDDLARGINPITKEEVDENDVINNIKISRCLLYVSDILNEAAQNGIPKRKASEKFDVQKIEIEKFEYSSEPQPISIIAQKINALKPEIMTKLKTTALTGWLVDIGILNVVEINGKNHKRPARVRKIWEFHWNSETASTVRTMLFYITKTRSISLLIIFPQSLKQATMNQRKNHNKQYRI